MTNSPLTASTASSRLPELVIHDSVGVCGVRDDTRRMAEAAAASGPPGRALDMGTGSGFIGLYLAQRGWQVDAVDVSPRAVELAQQNARRNGLAAADRPGGVRVFQSNLFDQVDGPYDVIAFNPPMRPDENELSRIVTSLLRRSPRVSGWLMKIVGERFESGRSPFLAQVVAEARLRLRPGGRLLLGISEEETAEIAALPGVTLARSQPLPSMVRQVVAEFTFQEPA